MDLTEFQQLLCLIRLQTGFFPIVYDKKQIMVARKPES